MMSTSVGGQQDERGAVAVEHAVVTVAAASLGGVLLAMFGGGYPQAHPIVPPEWFLKWMLQLIEWITSLFRGA
ncbi:DUF4244 domain-containing protein [Enemella evansiae]|uniref:DUF4244 domain-containing protein n=1 Tax=Enemella evansiae TaxID=2016499 RepID=UPI00117E9BC1|nr:DUF4244 domain-containing protein [Enemella evansiae]